QAIPSANTTRSFARSNAASALAISRTTTKEGSGSRESTWTQQCPAKNASANRPTAPPCAMTKHPQIRATTCDTCAPTYAQTCFQIHEPPAPSLEAALVHAAVPCLAGAPCLLGAQSAQRDARFRIRCLPRLRASPWQLLTGGHPRSHLAAQRSRSRGRYVGEQPAHDGSLVLLGVLGGYAVARRSCARSRVPHDVVMAANGPAADLEALLAGVSRDGGALCARGLRDPRRPLACDAGDEISQTQERRSRQKRENAGKRSVTCEV